jgi:hypothetical protein
MNSLDPIGVFDIITDEFAGFGKISSKGIFSMDSIPELLTVKLRKFDVLEHPFESVTVTV